MKPTDAFTELEKADNAIRPSGIKHSPKEDKPNTIIHGCQILSFKNGDYILELNKENRYCGMKSETGGCTLEYGIAVKMPIYSLKRLKDGEIFSIRDEVCVDNIKLGNIIKFVVEKGGLLVTCTKCSAYVQDITKNKQFNVDSSFLKIGRHIPTAFYDNYTKSWWKFNEKEQIYISDKYTNDRRSLRYFELAYPRFLPFYNDKQISLYKDYLTI